jgi:hypothetical protein
MSSSDPWVPSTVLLSIVHEAPADEGLLADLADVRGALIEDVQKREIADTSVFMAQEIASTDSVSQPSPRSHRQGS